MAPSLWQLCEQGDIVGVRAALARGEDVNSKDAYNDTGLMCAVMGKHNELVKFSVEQPTVDVNCTDGNSFTALHIAAEEDNVEAVQMLLADARINTANQKNLYGDTPVMYAMAVKSLNTLRELVTHPSINLDTKDSFGKGLVEEVAR